MGHFVKHKSLIYEELGSSIYERLFYWINVDIHISMAIGVRNLKLGGLKVDLESRYLKTSFYWNKTFFFWNHIDLLTQKVDLHLLSKSEENCKLFFWVKNVDLKMIFFLLNQFHFNKQNCQLYFSLSCLGYFSFIHPAK